MVMIQFYDPSVSLLRGLLRSMTYFACKKVCDYLKFGAKVQFYKLMEKNTRHGIHKALFLKNKL